MSLKNDIEKGLWDELSESAQKKAEKYLNSVCTAEAESLE